MSKKLNEIKNEFMEWTRNSTAHGITNFFKTEKSELIRFMWLIFFLGSLSFCCYSLTLSFIQFFEYDVLINIEIEKDALADYPVVSICNLNKYSTNKSLKYIEDMALENNIKFIDTNQSLVENGELLNNLVTAKYLNNLTGNSVQNSSLSLDKMLISCLYTAKICTLNDFEWFYSNEYGNCYRFNGKEKRVQTRAGKYYGLRLELYVGEPDSIFSLTSQTGVHVFINNDPNEYLSNGKDVSTGFSNDISLTRRSIHRLEEPYSDCIKNDQINKDFQSKYFEKTIHLFKVYQRQACIDLCVQDYIESNCNCSAIMYPQFNSSKNYCSTIEKLNCTDFFNEIFFQNQDYTNTCQLKCRTECDTESYDYLISFSDYPSKVYADGLLRQKNVMEKFSLKNETTYETMKTSILLLNIFFSSFDKVVINEVEKLVFTDFLGLIGGTLGLCIGISFLSIVELIELVMIVFFISIKK